ncbi:hypothetical protein M3J09_012075 [Ascochyta lentis]
MPSRVSEQQSQLARAHEWVWPLAGLASKLGASTLLADRR